MSDTQIALIPTDELSELWFSLKQQVLSKLQAAARRSKLTQEDIAARIRKSPAVISRCLRGKENMTLRTMHEIARGMNCRLRIELDDLNNIPPTNRPRRDEPLKGVLVDPEPRTQAEGNSYYMLIEQ
jgi:transcriptional regulator with XRE-family HTH domain